MSEECPNCDNVGWYLTNNCSSLPWEAEQVQCQWCYTNPHSKFNETRYMLSDLNKFNEFIKDRNEFSHKTFGSPELRDCTGPLRHLQDEVQELLENPNDEMEWADCFLLLLDAAWRKGHSIDDLLTFATLKLEINKRRTWEKRDNGTYKHVE